MVTKKISKAKTAAESSVGITKLEISSHPFGILGKSPLIPHRLSQKARQQLLLPGKRLNRAGLEAQVKHDVPHEFRESLYRNRDPNSPALFHLPSGMVVQALASAALDMPGTAKAKCLRLLSVAGQIDLYGLPSLKFDMVRQDGVSHTPDVRTRGAFHQWGCVVGIEWPSHTLSGREVSNLLAAAGYLAGFGDWRQQKGGCYGNFEVVEATDPRLQAIIKTQGRAAQQAAFDACTPFDDETAELLDWYYEEIHARQQGGQLVAVENMEEAAE